MAGRDDGFRIADTDTGLMADPKVLALARRQRDGMKTLAAVGLYEAVRLASWDDGERVAAASAVPGWCLDDVEALIADLTAVGLLDPDGRIPEGAWSHWYTPAADRRDRYRDLGRRGGIASALKRTVDPTPEPAVNRTLDRSVNPVRSLPTDRPFSRAQKRDDERPRNGRLTSAAAILKDLEL